MAGLDKPGGCDPVQPITVVHEYLHARLAYAALGDQGLRLLERFDFRQQQRREEIAFHLVLGHGFDDHGVGARGQMLNADFDVRRSGAFHPADHAHAPGTDFTGSAGNDEVADLDRYTNLAAFGEGQSAGAFVLDVPGRIFPLRHPRRGGFLFLDPELGALRHGPHEVGTDDEFFPAVDPVVDGIEADGDVHAMTAALTAAEAALRVDAPGADASLQQILAGFLKKIFL